MRCRCRWGPRGGRPSGAHRLSLSRASQPRRAGVHCNLRQSRGRQAGRYGLQPAGPAEASFQSEDDMAAVDSL
ncbi:unnamed protein product, partial [Urochloa humidicola]